MNSLPKSPNKNVIQQKKKKKQKSEKKNKKEKKKKNPGALHSTNQHKMNGGSGMI